MRLAVVRNLDSVRQYANPLDHWVILPILRALPRRWGQTALEKESLQTVARPLEPDAAVPGLPGWRSIMTPGHSPGHLSFFRESDRVLLSGDALLTVNMGSVGGLLAWLLRPRVARLSAPPRYTNWDAQKMRESIVAIARLEPRVVAGGHGVPLSSDETASLVHGYAARMGAIASGSP
jgi:glyoxylase-like metal-dependent hydrolase (beta-lactamase superfamily II)